MALSAGTRKDFVPGDMKSKKKANDDANAQMTMGTVLAAGGAATVIGGLTWWWLDQNKSKNSQASNANEPSFWLGFSGISTVSVSGRF